MKTIARNTYTYQVKSWLESGRSITSKEAIDAFGCTRLAAIIAHLKNVHDMPIRSDLMSVKNRNGRWVDIARYSLVEEGQ